MTKKLFKVNKRAFNNKMDAKDYRNQLNLEAGYNPDPKDPKGIMAIASGKDMPFKVTKDTDHHGYS